MRFDVSTDPAPNVRLHDLPPAQAKRVEGFIPTHRLIAFYTRTVEDRMMEWVDAEIESVVRVVVVGIGLTVIGVIIWW